MIVIAIYSTIAPYVAPSANMPRELLQPFCCFIEGRVVRAIGHAFDIRRKFTCFFYCVFLHKIQGITSLCCHVPFLPFHAIRKRIGA